jgi:predicted Fe-Mo cluster-binding NifX family protein
VSQHFGRSSCFIVYEIEDQVVKSEEVRANTFTAHAQGQCDGGERAHHEHSHASIVEALRDCNAVLCRGMGWRAADELSAAGIKPIIVAACCSPNEAALMYARGELPEYANFCRCDR